MIGSKNVPLWPSVDEVVEAYEAAQARDGYADIEAFVPSTEHPEYLEILCELVRVDLEYAWRRGEPCPVEAYQERFPGLFQDRRLSQEIRFEEMRLKLQAEESLEASPGSKADLKNGPSPLVSSEDGGGSASASAHARLEFPAPLDREQDVVEAAKAYRDYRASAVDDPAGMEALFASRRIPPAERELFRDLHSTATLTADRLADAVTTLPRIGSEFLGFRLQEELGRGAFGRVYLARQTDMADRLVALKVSADVAQETNALAQLQHTNIVPIYSVHRSGPLQAVCMPYLGSTTLADVLCELRRHESLPDSGLGLLTTRRRTTTPLPETRSIAPADSGIHGAKAPLKDSSNATGQYSVPRSTAQVERLRSLGYVQAVLWLIAHAADGLEHAHQRGILHRDLKPANILFGDDGEPLLLDFNLSTDTKLQSHASAAMIGGTLPYLAPEHLEAFQDGIRNVDSRSDVYSLGVILFELLTGRHPFEVRRGSVDELLPLMIADRRGALPDPRTWNRRVSAAVQSIVWHCLDPDPAKRYQSARELEEDLRCQLEDRRLEHAPDRSVTERVGKWARRHPRLASTTTVIILAVGILSAVVLGFLVRQRNLSKLEALDALRQVSAEVAQADYLLSSRAADPRQIREGVDLCTTALRRYHAIDDPKWTQRPLVRQLPSEDRDRLRDLVGDLFLLYARAVTWEVETTKSSGERAQQIHLASHLSDLAASCFRDDSTPRALWLQRAQLANLAKHDDQAQQLRQQAAGVPLRSSRDRFWLVADRLDRGERRDLLSTVRETTRLEPRNYTNWLLLGTCYAQLKQFDEAAYCFGTGIALHPELSWAYYNRGLAYLDLKKHQEALEDFDQVIRLRPNQSEAYVNRAISRLGLNDAAGAVADLTRALQDPKVPTRAWYLRATARSRMGDVAGARQDFGECIKREPRDELSWIVRGLARLANDAAGALADYDAALALNPRSHSALQNKANVLAEPLGRTEEAIQVLDTAIRLEPEAVDSLAGRGVLLARLGRWDAARTDARNALSLPHQPLHLYQVAGIYALTSKHELNDRREALRLLAEAFRKDPDLLAMVPRDPELTPIRDVPEFHELLQAFAVVQKKEAPDRKNPSREQR
jgi:eukaryotic-like serine/threonine-protein kinase